MLANLICKFFGGPWKLKKICQTTRNYTIKKILISLYSFYQYENGSSIAWNSTFKGEPCFPHGMKSIFISGGVEIGLNCVIFQQVTIGSNTLVDSKNIGTPSFGNNCYIGAGATIIGDIKIGNNVRIGSNTTIYKDVPDNSIVVSGNQRLIEKNATLNNRFYMYPGQWVYYDNGQWFPELNEDILHKFKELTDKYNS